MTLLSQIQELTEDLNNESNKHSIDSVIGTELKELLVAVIKSLDVTNEELLSALLEAKMPEDIAEMATDKDVLPIVLNSLWQSIETAPTVEDVLVFIPTVLGFYITGGCLLKSGTWIHNTDSEVIHPTYWMPLPKEPSR